MKKIIALALALIMALSMASVAFAAGTPAPTAGTCNFLDWTLDNGVYKSVVTESVVFAPGETIEFARADWATATKPIDGYKITKVDFTTGALDGANMVESVKITKEKDAFRMTLKESYTMAEETAKDLKGIIYVSHKVGNTTEKYELPINLKVNNTVKEVFGAKKAAGAEYLAATEFGKNVVTVMDDDGGYVKFDLGELEGTVKMEKNEKTYLNAAPLADDALDAFEAALGEDFEGIVETYAFETRAFKNDVDFRYDAYEDDPHFFYKWDGEKFTAIDAKYDADEDVDDYVFTTTAEDTIVVSDVELVAAEEETKNPDTGANDVVGVAAALAVVSLVAAGAVSLKK